MSNDSPLALLVEDHCDTAEMYARYLEHAGFRVTVARTAAEAFLKAVNQAPAVVVTAVRLPDGPDGVTLAAKLRLDRRTNHLPIIVLTGDALTKDRNRAYAAGCDVFLTKPCSPLVLAEQARTLLRSVSTTPDLRAGTSVSQGDL
jgi:two-component system cell cycle response regulator DivK